MKSFLKHFLEYFFIIIYERVEKAHIMFLFLNLLKAHFKKLLNLV